MIEYEDLNKQILRDHKVAMKKLETVSKRLRAACASGDVQTAKRLLNELVEVHEESIEIYKH